MSSEHPPAGWVSLGGVLEPGSRVADYAARGQRVKGTCRAKGCNRRVDLDPKALSETGYGTVNSTRPIMTAFCAALSAGSLDGVGQLVSI